jgi:shikimate dehydrogenase
MNNIKGTTKVTGIIGWPVEHTLSPIMHNAGFAQLGLDFCYLPLAVKPEELGPAVAGLRALNIRGVNVTVPHKEKVIKYLDEVRGPARLIGAVNTIINKDGQLIGYNTDGPGFIEFLKKTARFNPRNKTIVIFGAGGAARAFSFMLFSHGARAIFLFDIDRKKSLSIKKALCQHFPGQVNLLELKSGRQFAKILGRTDLLINATPIGMPPHEKESPLKKENFAFLKKDCLVVDSIYHPAKTIFLLEAEKRKLKIFNGTSLLVQQGVLAFELFTGKKIKPAVFYQALGQSGQPH